MNPFLDFPFKWIFGQEASKSLLIDFLNNLLVGERHILDVEYRDKEQLSEAREGHSTIYDIYCKTDTGEYIIVEMQNRKEPLFLQRTLYYAARSIERQGREPGEWAYEVKAVYCIAFMNFTDERLPSRLRVDVSLCDRDTGVQVNDLLRFVYLQLPLFKKKQDECETFFERWIYILKNMDVLDELPKAFQCEAFRKLKEVSDVATLSPNERLKYEDTLRIYRDTLLTVRNARTEGMEQGEKIGLKKGLKEGRERIIQMARQLKSLGVSIDNIKQSSGLSEDEIRSL
jgi:predicted transposase/invertase (TIGR01784 family)